MYRRCQPILQKLSQYLWATSIFSVLHVFWLVVSTPLKNISQMGSLLPIYGKTKMFQTTSHQPVFLSASVGEDQETLSTLK
jgi:hypothetical protein